MRFYARNLEAILSSCWPAVTRPSSPCAGRSSGWCPRRDSRYRDGRKRRELLGRAEERLGRDEEPGGPLQRPALRGQERSRWTATLSNTHTQTHARAKRRRPAQEQGDSLWLTLRIFLGCWAYFKQRLFYAEKQVCYGKLGDFKLHAENIKCQLWSEYCSLIYKDFEKCESWINKIVHASPADVHQLKHLACVTAKSCVVTVIF